MQKGLGTRLRHLVELLDGAVQDSYTEAGLDYRPRYTPIVRALLARGACTVGELAAVAGISQPAATQTIARMERQGLLAVRAGKGDARVREVRLTGKARRLIPRLEACWRATEAAAQSLEDELAYPLSRCLDDAISLLDSRPFGARIAAARAAQERGAER